MKASVLWALFTGVACPGDLRFCIGFAVAAHKPYLELDNETKSSVLLTRRPSLPKEI
jgi:hypothetical protein